MQRIISFLANNNDDNDLLTCIDQWDVYNSLKHLNKTASGYDNVPYWLLKHCANFVTLVVTQIFNHILCSGDSPSSWKKALITPVDKVSKPESYADLRPISVLPILSRVFERIFVRKFIIPRMPEDLYMDQFAYRPISSTTAALIYTIHHVTHLLESNSFVYVALLLTFHELLTRLTMCCYRAKYNIIQQNFSTKIILWIANFLAGHIQAVAANGKRSIWLPISQSIIQGSGIGPILYIIVASHLKAVSDTNKICKYADDTTLMIGELSDANFVTEFNNITEWASRNKLKLNLW
jgi:hypothetical protein